MCLPVCVCMKEKGGIKHSPVVIVSGAGSRYLLLALPVCVCVLKYPCASVFNDFFLSIYI